MLIQYSRTVADTSCASTSNNFLLFIY